MSWMLPPTPFQALRIVLGELWRHVRDALAGAFILGAVAMGVLGFLTQDKAEEDAEMKRRELATAASLVVSEVGDQAKKLELGERARLVMRTSHQHWLFDKQLDENEEFKLAVAALVLCSEDEMDKRRIEREWRFLQALGEAMEHGTPVDLDEITDELAKDPIGLLAIWKSVVADARGLGTVEFDAGKSQ